MIEYSNSSLHITDSILWLDAKKSKELSFQSVFSKNYIKHERVIASRETAHFLRKFSLTKTPLNILQLSNFKKFSIGDLSITIYPSGANLGSSQILIKRANEKILYSGLVNTINLDIWEEIYFPSADYLVFKTNFGEESYSFPDIKQEFKNLLDYIENNKNSNIVIFTKDFGLAQLILKNISKINMPIYLQNRIYEYALTFRDLKVDLGEFKKLNIKSINKASIIIYPIDKIKNFSEIDNSKKIFISGKSPNKEFLNKIKIDKNFIISNEGDFQSCIQFIENIAPKKLYLLPGENKDLEKYFKNKIYVKTFNEIKEKSLF